MAKKVSAQKKVGPPSTTERGRFLEQIVASLHDVPGVKVERNVYMPTLTGNRRREIDILITASVAGYLVRVAIECKNERELIGAPRIDAFMGKLADVGIPTQQGIFVSSSGYTKGAISRATGAGIKPLVLHGLIPGSLEASVVDALQSAVYLLAEIDEIQISNNVPSASDIGQAMMMIFYDETGEICSTVPHLVWQEWLMGSIPASIGKHLVEVNIPENWHQLVDGRRETVLAVRATVQVTGLIVAIAGQAKQFSLVDAASRSVEKFQIDLSFKSVSNKLPVTTVRSEDELQNLIDKTETIKITVGRVRLPRIRMGPMYWPPSERAIAEVTKLMKAFEAGESDDPRPIDISVIEGDDMRAIWDV